MSVYMKLNAARAAFHAAKIEKTGLNKFAGYKYFELADFIVPALKIFAEHDLCAVVSFGHELATMTITSLVDGQSIVITSPMSTAALKGCHEVQNLGAVQTYLRRYLWVAALEIVEHDAVDSSEPSKEEPKKPAKLTHSKGNERAGTTAARVANEIIEAIRADLTLRVVEKYEAACEEPGDFADQVWARFGPEERDYITNALNEANKQAA